MKRRDFLKGMAAVAVVAIAAPAVSIATVQPAQALARKTPWKLLGTDKCIRTRCELFVYERIRDGEKQWAEVRVPFQAEWDEETATWAIGELYP